jgi:hypothetical protein
MANLGGDVDWKYIQITVDTFCKFCHTSFMSKTIKKKPLKFARSQLATIFDALVREEEFLRDFGSSAKNARRQVIRLTNKVQNHL